MAENNPLLQALPPAVDYLSYLILLEHNLTAKQLPVLHDILQDTTLTANIGWDLVHLLLPLLPESQTCLQDVARLGNPREVVLTVTELLEGLISVDKDDEQDEEEEDQEEVVEGSAEQAQAEEPSAATRHRSQENTQTARPEEEHQAESQDSPSKVSKFCALLDLLAILHPRIKTKHPSRFLSTSLQPVLLAYATLLSDDQATQAVLRFIKTFAGSKRPRLPPRKISTQIPSQQEQTLLSAPDPEASEEPIAPEENALQRKLLQSFLTFAVEGYMSSLPSDEEAAAMSWSSRFYEQLRPEKHIPGRRTMRAAFEEDESLHRRDSIMGHMLALTRDLDLSPNDFINTLNEPEDPTNKEDLDDLPSSASDVPLSRPGCLYLLCATIASNVLFYAPITTPDISFSNFHAILRSFLGEPSSGSIGTESPSLIDSLLFLGADILSSDKTPSAHPQDENNDEHHTATLQRLALLSANTPCAPLRYHAHRLAYSVLHSHPNPNFRLTFIKDTLEHCPYENLRASAVGWLKDEILAADKTGHNDSPFSTAVCIQALAPHLFRNPFRMSDEEVLAHQAFFLAVLNLYQLVLSSPTLREKMGVMVVDEGLGYQSDGDGDWLMDMAERVEAFDDKVGLEEDGDMRIVLLGEVIAMCEDKVKRAPR